MQNQLSNITGRQRRLPNPNIDVSPEMLQQLEKKRLVRLLTGPTIAIVPVGRGRRPEGRTVLEAVRHGITTSVRELAVASMMQTLARQAALQKAMREAESHHSLTLTAAPPSDCWGLNDAIPGFNAPKLIGVDHAVPGSDVTVEVEMPEVEL